MTRRVLASLFALLLLAIGCQSSAPPAPAPEASASRKSVFGFAPIGAPQQNYVGLSTSTAIVKSSAATLYLAYIVNRAASASYFQLFDQTSAASGTPTFQYLLPATSATQIPVPGMGQGAGISFANGLVFGCSTTNGSYTAGTASNYDVELVYQ
jgi:hypothetical protein